MRNVKLKVPAVPHEIFGRIVSKDEFFPTAIGTFKMDVEPDMFVDRSEATKKRKVVEREPEALTLPVYSATKFTVWERDQRSFELVETKDFIEIARLTLR